MCYILMRGRLIGEDGTIIELDPEILEMLSWNILNYLKIIITIIVIIFWKTVFYSSIKGINKGGIEY